MSFDRLRIRTSDPSRLCGTTNGSFPMSETDKAVGSCPPSEREPSGQAGSHRDPASLAAAAARGDLRATQTLLEQLAPAIHRAVRSVLGPQHPDTDDVVQQAMIAFVQSLPHFRGECQPSTYALSIAIRAALAARKRALKDNVRREALVHSNARNSIVQALPIEHLQAESRRVLVRRLLDALPPEQAETLGLHVVLDLPLKEIAKSLGVSINTIKSRLRLAKRALRARILTNQPVADELEVVP
jgi:RNA polymerase sigma factor (sigma-70 family)